MEQDFFEWYYEEKSDLFEINPKYYDCIDDKIMEFLYNDICCGGNSVTIYYYCLYMRKISDF